MRERSAPHPARTAQAGQATPLIAALVVLAAVMALALVQMGGGAIDMARARTAADAGALAGAAEGEARAAAVVVANGGRLLAYEEQAADVIVRVRVGTAEVEARARADRRSRGPG